MSLKWCSVYNCQFTSSGNLKRTFYTFPKQDEVLQKWIMFVRKSLLNWTPLLKRVYLCSSHFNQEDFVNYDQFINGYAKLLLLKKDAIPSVYHSDTSCAKEITKDETLCSHLEGYTASSSAPHAKSE